MNSSEYKKAMECFEPGPFLRARVAAAVQDENQPRVKPLRRVFLTAAAAALALVCTMAAATAAWIFLRPAQVSEQFNDHTLSRAFDSENAISINASATAGDYTFTLLGMVSGEGISDYLGSAAQVQPQRTYTVLAIHRADGAAISEDEAFELFGNYMVTPLIQGLQPWQFNIASMGGSYSEALVDGVLYRLTECDSIMLFADRKLYLGVCDSTFVMNGTFLFDEATGEISVNPDYTGVSAVFELPVDPSHADPERAEEYLKQLYEALGLSETGAVPDTAPAPEDDTPNAGDAELSPEAQTLVDRIRDARDNTDWESLVPVEDSYRELTVDADGYLCYDYPLEDGLNNAGFTMLAEVIFDRFDQGEEAIYLKNVSGGSSADGEISLNIYAVRLTKIDDNTVAAVMVVPV